MTCLIGECDARIQNRKREPGSVACFSGGMAVRVCSRHFEGIYSERGIVRLTAGFRARHGRVLLFDPTNPLSAAYNPLLEVRKGEWEVRDVQNVADVPPPKCGR